MSVIAFVDLAKLLDQAGFRGGVPSANGIAIVCAESGRDPNARFVNNDQWQSVDRGLWQINNHWHPEVTDEEAYDPAQATAAALRISNGGIDYTSWSTWGNGAYKTHLEAARVALDGWARVKKLQQQIAQTDSAVKAALSLLEAVSA